MSKRVMCATVPIGSGAPVSVQSMTNTDTRDAHATCLQAQALAQAGCDLVRVSVYDEACVRAMPAIVAGAGVPIVADIHFDHRLAISALEAGAAKVRINPGNIGGEQRVKAVADCARAYHAPIRIGVNSGSLEKALLTKYGGPTAEALAESALVHAKMLEMHGFEDIVLSVKASNVREMIHANRILHKTCAYPLHLGVTEAGLPERGSLASAIGIGALLADGIGDTIRVSLSGDPVQEVPVALSLLKILGLRPGVTVIACPTCGRTGIDVAAIARRVEEATQSWQMQATIAVMGCVVNGPGEAREADLGVAGGRDGFVLFEKGQTPIKGVGDPGDALLAALNQWREHHP